MHYYQFHVGDYLSSTSHLSNEEDLAYRRLLDMYYTSEKPIPLNTQWVARRLRVASEVVELVLKDFFTQTPDGYTKERCEQEICRYKQLAERNKRNGSLGGRPKANPVGSQQDTNGIPEEPSRNLNQEPVTKNQEPLDLEANASMSGTGFPPCPHQEILKLYAKHLPHLAQPRVWDGARAAHLKARWAQASKPSSYSPGGYSTHQEGLEWWDSFFEYVSKTKLAAGFESHGRIWRPDITWLVKAENFAKIIEQRYE